MRLEIPNPPLHPGCRNTSTCTLLLVLINTRSIIPMAPAVSSSDQYCQHHPRTCTTSSTHSFTSSSSRAASYQPGSYRHRVCMCLHRASTKPLGIASSLMMPEPTGVLPTREGKQAVPEPANCVQLKALVVRLCDHPPIDGLPVV